MNRIIKQAMVKALKEKYNNIVNAPKNAITSIRDLIRVNKRLNEIEENEKFYYLALSLSDEKELADRHVRRKYELIEKYGYKELHEYVIKKSAELNI